MISYSIWPWFALLAGVLLILRCDRPFAAVDATARDPGLRVHSIDGLRGILALGVFGHHAALIPAYFETGIWRAPPSNFYTMIGEIGVALFFSVTGFLFWGKLLDARGEPDWKRLYVVRLFRIGPVYLAVVLVMLSVVIGSTQFELREPLPEVILDTVRWLALGALGQPDVNGFQDTGRLLAGVTWTLQYEWLFYLSLPLLAPFARRNGHLWFTLTGLVISCALLVLYERPHAFYAGLFFCGMISASLTHGGWEGRVARALAPVMAPACLWLLFTQFSTSSGVFQLFLIGIFFWAICAGGGFSRLLEAKPVRRLGEISYSIYLIHGLVLMAVFSVEAIRDYAFAGRGHYWLVVVACCLLVIFTATLSYLIIERPGIQLGRRWGVRLASSRAVAQESGRAPV